MKKSTSPIPVADYGILMKDRFVIEFDEIAEQVRRIGYAVLDSGLSDDEISNVSKAFDQARAAYLVKYGESQLKCTNEFHTIRAMLALEQGGMFIRLATNPNLMIVLSKLILGKFILNQQNGIINPPGETYNQGAWHRDLPYQHYVSSSPLAINALFCVDEFTLENGSTFVLPASHKSINYPTAYYIQRNALQIQARAGQFILLDCMLFHSGGFNKTDTERRAVNHVYTIPYFKQQIKLSEMLKNVELTPDQKELFGFCFQEPLSIEQFLDERMIGAS
jgi:ectoine hydroxylase-related dioxygenase (phytanoyl-CoA dioxygenase family)